MRKKERSGPGIATVVDSEGATLASPADRGSEGVAAGTIGARDESIRRTAAMRAMVRNKGFAKGFAKSFADKDVKRSVQALKIASPTKT